MNAILCGRVYKLYMKQHPMLCHVAVVSPLDYAWILFTAWGHFENGNIGIWWFDHSGHKHSTKLVIHKLVLVLSSEESVLLCYLFLSLRRKPASNFIDNLHIPPPLLGCWMRILKVPAYILATAVGKKWLIPLITRISSSSETTTQINLRRQFRWIPFTGCVKIQLKVGPFSPSQSSKVSPRCLFVCLFLPCDQNIHCADNSRHCQKSVCS